MLTTGVKKQCCAHDWVKVCFVLNNKPPSYWKRIWDQAKYRIAVDGGINWLYDSEHRESCVPDVIVGDMDSAKKESLNYYSEKGMKMFSSQDQNTTDFEKAVGHLLSLHVDCSKHLQAAVIGAMSDRIDHTLANISVMSKYASRFEINLYSELSIASFLEKGEHVIQGHIGQECGIVPINGTWKVTTRGLKWNLDRQELAFGKLISSSNVITEEQVVVDTEGPLLWTIVLEKRESGAAL